MPGMAPPPFNSGSPRIEPHFAHGNAPRPRRAPLQRPVPAIFTSRARAHGVRGTTSSHSSSFMAQLHSFDVTTGVDLQEVDNAVNQAQKEIAQRYDFKGVKAEIEFQRAEEKLVLTAQDEYRMDALYDVLHTRLIRRGVPVKNLELGEIKPAGGDTVRREVSLRTSLDGETAKKVAAAIKAAKLKKVQAAIQGDQVRVTAPGRDELQEAIGVLKAEEFDVELQFGNYR